MLMSWTKSLFKANSDLFMVSSVHAVILDIEHVSKDLEESGCFSVEEIDVVAKNPFLIIQ